MTVGPKPQQEAVDMQARRLGDGKEPRAAGQETGGASR